MILKNNQTPQPLSNKKGGGFNITLTMNPKIVFDEGNGRIVTEDDTKNVLYTDPFDIRVFPTFRDVVTLWNDNKSLQEIDDFLLSDERCTQEEREEIIESFYNTFAAKEFGIKISGSGTAQEIVDSLQDLVDGLRANIEPIGDQGGIFPVGTIEGDCIITEIEEQ